VARRTPLSDRGHTATGDASRIALTASAISMGAGVCGAIQPEINSQLGIRVGSSLVAAFVNFTVAFLVALAVMSRRPTTRRHLAGITSWPVPRWTFLAGLGGVTVVVSALVTVERLGVAIFSIAFFAGQMTFGLVVDWLGITASGGKRPVTTTRVGAAAMAIAAVVLAQIGQPAGDLAPAAIVFVVVAGGASAFQSAFNGRIAATIGDPLAPTVVNTFVGTVALVAILTGVAVTGSIGPLDWPGEPWLYTGGVFGVTIVLSLATASAAIGVLRTTVAMLAAQLITAFTVDWVVRDEPPTAGIITAAVVIILAVLLVNRGTMRVPARGPLTPS
jgi:bacterial/archaeal transporter family-2 protein